MPRVYHVKKARKDNPIVKKGEPYYWWKFRYGGKRYSKTYPKRQQLTQSGFKISLYDIEDSLSESLSKAATKDDLQSVIDGIVPEIESLRDECKESLSNMPEHLQQDSSSGELLQERIDNLEEWAGEFENFDTENGDQEFEGMREEIEGICYQGG
jgi:hypothetical protein